MFPAPQRLTFYVYAQLDFIFGLRYKLFLGEMFAMVQKVLKSDKK